MLVASNAFILYTRHSKISLQEFNDLDEVEEEMCAKVTSVMAKSIIVRIGTKKQVLECSEEIVKSVEDCIPCKRTLKVKGDVVMSCSK